MLILKYDLLLPAEEREITMPAGATILTVQPASSAMLAIYMWAIADPDAESSKRKFLLIETGVEMKYPTSNLTYIGTCIFKSSFANTIHVFEIL